MKVQTLSLCPSTCNQRKEQISSLPSHHFYFWRSTPPNQHRNFTPKPRGHQIYFQVPGNQLETPKTQVYFQLPPKKCLRIPMFSSSLKKASVLSTIKKKTRPQGFTKLPCVGFKTWKKITNPLVDGGFGEVGSNGLKGEVESNQSPTPNVPPPTRNSRPKLRVYLLTIGFPWISRRLVNTSFWGGYVGAGWLTSHKIYIKWM